MAGDVKPDLRLRQRRGARFFPRGAATSGPAARRFWKEEAQLRRPTKSPAWSTPPGVWTHDARGVLVLRVVLGSNVTPRRTAASNWSRYRALTDDPYHDADHGRGPLVFATPFCPTLKTNADAMGRCWSLREGADSARTPSTVTASNLCGRGQKQQSLLSRPRARRPRGRATHPLMMFRRFLGRVEQGTARSRPKEYESSESWVNAWEAPERIVPRGFPGTKEHGAELAFGTSLPSPACPEVAPRPLVANTGRGVRGSMARRATLPTCLDL